MPDDAAACHDLVQVYPSDAGAVPALRGIDARFPIGSITVVAGASGAGTSSLLRLLAGLEGPTAGEVWIAGRRTAQLGQRARRRLAAQHVAYVFQRPRDNLVDYLTVAEHVALGARMRTGRVVAHVVAAGLDLFGLREVAGRRPNGLSAGEQQRLAFATAAAGDPALVVADEPSAELDAPATAGLLDVLHHEAARGRTFVLATHDPVLVAAADQRLLVSNGSLVASSRRGENDAAVIDEGGRIRLPDDVLSLFPTRRASIERDGTGVRIDPR